MEREKTRVLLIEDNPAPAQHIEELLKTAGEARYALTTLGRFADAGERLVQQQWDVIVLDLVLPNGEGIELVRRIKELAPDVPLLIVTATDDEELALGAIREGAQDYLVKGQFDGPQLWRVIHRAIERNRAAAHFRQIHQTLTNMDSTVRQLQRLGDTTGLPPEQSTPPPSGGSNSGSKGQG
jgi:DNA-binding response OmpR family regulator